MEFPLVIFVALLIYFSQKLYNSQKDEKLNKILKPALLTTSFFSVITYILAIVENIILLNKKLSLCPVPNSYLLPVQLLGLLGLIIYLVAFIMTFKLTSRHLRTNMAGLAVLYVFNSLASLFLVSFCIGG